MIGCLFVSIDIQSNIHPNLLQRGSTKFRKTKQEILEIQYQSREKYQISVAVVAISLPLPQQNHHNRGQIVPLFKDGQEGGAVPINSIGGTGEWRRLCYKIFSDENFLGMDMGMVHPTTTPKKLSPPYFLVFLSLTHLQNCRRLQPKLPKPYG